LRLVVGLGNPGPEYEDTRHNVGFRVVDRLAREEGIDVRRPECRALTGRGSIAGLPAMLAKPVTYMNASGEAIADLLKETGIEEADMLVISDDIDLPVGVLRFRPGGSSGGQKGLKSIAACLGTTEFPRLRVGIRGPDYSREFELGEYVLDRFSPAEQQPLEEALGRAVEAVRVWVASGLTDAMNKFNAAPEFPGP
jgi:PTH1 family peptidyl-tRNA hydrolase